MTLLSFNSMPHPDDEYKYTKLSIESANAHVTKIEMCRHSETLYSMPTLGVPIFAIRFDLYDLTANRMTETSVTYSPDNPGGGMTVKEDALAGFIEYNKVPPVSSAAISDTINVRLSFKGLVGTGNYGWLDLDIDYSYPAAYGGDTGRYAWQATLLYPRISLSKTATAANDALPFGDYSLLLPLGDRGAMKNLTLPITELMRVQFAALYKTAGAQATTPGSAQGIALMATDTLGHHKDVVFNPTADSVEFSVKLISPIHLKAKQYVQPVHPTRPGYAFGLSQEDSLGHGFGRADTLYRLYAFHLKTPIAGVPPDWRDVADLYRHAVLSASGRQANFFTKKKPRSTSGPIDNLSPHTVICNYALDGPIPASVQDKNLQGAWLEIHPIKLNNKTDMRGPNGKVSNPNESLQDALKRIRARVNTPDGKVLLEAQLWGFEMGGFYQYYGGFPPITNVLNNDPDRFKKVMAQLVNAGVSLSITTAPILPYFNHSRFAGHQRWVGGNSTDFLKPKNWVDWIQHPFPPEFKRPNSPLSTCALIEVDIVQPAKPTIQLKRTFIVKDYPAFRPHPNCADVEALVKNPGVAGETAGEQRLDANGLRYEPPKDIGVSNRFYGFQTLALCPTSEVERRYRTEWLPTLFKCGAKLIEFMLLGWELGIWDVCYNKDHQHLLPAPQESQKLAYDNVIGYGPWAVNRLQALCLAAQDVGLSNNESFALTIEGAPVEPLLPFVNEFYHSSPVLQYVYSEAILAKMDLGGNPSYVMPGYQEQRKLIKNAPPPNKPESIARPAYMIDDAQRDTEANPLPNDWLKACRKYFSDYFKITSYGLAPRFYPTGPKQNKSTPPAPKPSDPLAPANPLDPTNPPTYTYCRCIQDVFNLRGRIFDVGEKAVIGERVMVRDYFFVKSFGHPQPYDYYDYNEELINIMTRAIHMHIQESSFFRGGRMIGRTGVTLTGATEKVFALRAGYRVFDDVSPLMKNLQMDGQPPPKNIMDFLSIGYDKNAVLVSTDRLSQMVWQKQFGVNDLRYLYVFGHVGNTSLKFNFLYGRGLGASENWGKIIRVFDGRDHAGCDPSGAAAATTPTAVKQGDTETIFETYPLAPRSFAVVEVSIIKKEDGSKSRPSATGSKRRRGK